MDGSMLCLNKTLITEFSICGIIIYLQRLKNSFSDCQKQFISQTSFERLRFTRLETRPVHMEIEIWLQEMRLGQSQCFSLFRYWSLDACSSETSCWRWREILSRVICLRSSCSFWAVTSVPRGHCHGDHSSACLSLLAQVFPSHSAPSLDDLWASQTRFPFCPSHAGIPPLLSLCG